MPSLGALYFRDEDRVIAGIMMLHHLALEVRERFVEQDNAAVAATVRDSVESAGVGIRREAPRVGLLLR
jgi:hypothetical protein